MEIANDHRCNRGIGIGIGIAVTGSFLAAAAEDVLRRHFETKQ